MVAKVVQAQAVDRDVAAPDDVADNRGRQPAAAPPADLDVAELPDHRLPVFGAETAVAIPEVNAVDDAVVGVILLLHELSCRVVVTGPRTNAVAAFGDRAVANDVLAGRRGVPAFDLDADGSFGAGERSFAGRIGEVRPAAEFDAVNDEAGAPQPQHSNVSFVNLVAVDAGEPGHRAAERAAGVVVPAVERKGAAAAAEQRAAYAHAGVDRAREEKLLGRGADRHEHGPDVAVGKLEFATRPLGVERGGEQLGVSRGDRRRGSLGDQADVGLGIVLAGPRGASEREDQNSDRQMASSHSFLRRTFIRVRVHADFIGIARDDG